MGIAVKKFKAVTPINIINQFMNDNTVFGEPVLEEIAVDIVRYIHFYLREFMQSNNLRELKVFKTSVDNLIQVVNMACIWKALEGLLIAEIDKFY